MAETTDERTGEEPQGQEPLQGLKWLQRLRPLLARLRPVGCARDRAGNRQLFFDQAAALVLLTFFNPAMKSLRDLQQASRLQQVRKKLGVNETSLGSLSEALHVFDPALWAESAQELLSPLPDAPRADPRLKGLGRIPTAVDGTFLKQLPQITHACFATRKDRGWKLHAHFEVLRGVPVAVELTDGSGQGPAHEKAVLRRNLQPDRCYLLERGYEEFGLGNALVAAGSSYVSRLRQDRYWTVEEARVLTAEAPAAGVVEDSVGRLGAPQSKHTERPTHPQRRIVVRVAQPPKRRAPKQRIATHEWVLVSDLVDVPAEVLVLLYRYRWLIELFFRWLKCVLGGRHLLSASARGIETQIYCALIACLLIQWAAGRDVPPNQWTYKLLCLDWQGWAREEEVLAHLQQRAAAARSAS